MIQEIQTEKSAQTVSNDDDLTLVVQGVSFLNKGLQLTKVGILCI